VETRCGARAQVRRIDRRLKACHNPLLDPASDAFREQQAAAERAAADARQRKVQHGAPPCVLHSP